ncbi:MAG: hypothetical protein B1H11_12480 [Desulfobacteraceae bacterium 4484_190.1]|nr:MAG: hypothetical protein B1H11_12480 [Desulfobacteraceae bacterium 4484_190.1]
MKELLWVSFMALTVVLNAGCANGWTIAKVNLIIHVVDENGLPVDDVDIVGGGWIQGRPNAAGVKTKTDKDGLVIIKVKTASDVGFLFRKEGYYDSRMHWNPSGDPVKGYWQPNPIKESMASPWVTT